MKITFAASLLVGGVLSCSCPAAELAPSSTPAHIKNLRGCFHVYYRFVEDGTHDYEFKDATEWITLKQQPGAFVIQHYGLTGGSIAEHFSETWSLLPNGDWRQDIGPARYTCVSNVRMGQLHCSSPGAPKPNRDQRRVDYDVLNRVSTIQVTPQSWVQSETNDKVTKAGKVVATEVGWIEYRRLDNEFSCESAKKLHPSE